MLTLNDRLCRMSDEVIAKVMDGEAVIINLANGLYYSTDKVGGTIWTLIEAGNSIGAIATAVAGQYDVSAKQAADDALRLADELLRAELVAIESSPAVAVAAPAPAPRDRLPYEPPQLHAYTDMEDLLALDPPTPGLADMPWKG